jgi:hypothetical protein
MPNTVRLHRVLAMKREKVYRAFIGQSKSAGTQRLRAGISAALHGALWSCDRVDTAL